MAIAGHDEGPEQGAQFLLVLGVPDRGAQLQRRSRSVVRPEKPRYSE